MDHRAIFYEADSNTLPGGIGTINWRGFSFPLPAGPVELDMSIQMSAAIPASLGSTTIKLTGKGSDGDDLLCVYFSTAPELHLERAAQIEVIRSTPGVSWKARPGRFARRLRALPSITWA